MSPADDDLRLNIGQHCRGLEARAERLISESTGWSPINVGHAADLRVRQCAQHELLWDMAVEGGGTILSLSVRAQLGTAPRLQTRALQTRAEIRRFADAGTLPWDYVPVHAHGFDLLLVQLFEACCAIWLGQKSHHSWYGREVEVAATYSRFMRDLAQHLRDAGPAESGTGRP